MLIAVTSRFASVINVDIIRVCALCEVRAVFVLLLIEIKFVRSYIKFGLTSLPNDACLYVIVTGY